MDDLADLLREERQLPIHQKVDDTASRPHITLERIWLRLQQFRRGETWRSLIQTHAEQLRNFIRLHISRTAEIRHFETVPRNQDILRLQIPMNNPSAGHEDECLDELPEQCQDFPSTQLLILVRQVAEEITLFAEVHDDVDGLGRLVVVTFVYLDQVGMGQLHHNCNFAFHFVLAKKVDSADDLDCVGLVAAGGSPDHSVAALAQALLQRVLFHNVYTILI